MNIQHTVKWNNGKLATHCRNKTCRFINQDFGSDLKYIFEPILNGILSVKKPYGPLETLHYNLNKLTPPVNIIEIQREVEKVFEDVDMPGYMVKLDLTPKQMIMLTLLIFETTNRKLQYLDETIERAFSENSIKLQIIQQIVCQNILIKVE